MALQRTPQAGTQDFPWWLVMMGLAALGLAALIAVNDLYTQVFTTVARGIGVTVLVTLVAFSLATLMGLLVALAGLSGSLLLRQVARFYVELLRGIPILVLLFYIAFVGAPGFVWLYNSLAQPFIHAGLMDDLVVRDISLMWRTIIALSIGYSSFIAEIFRAGFQSVDHGQIEAAKSLGLSRSQRFRLVVLPQALRVVFPPLSNDFVSMVKDSSLVSVLGVADISQAGKIYASGSFRFFETYSIVAYLYLLLTIGLSLALRGVERRLRQRQGPAHQGVSPPASAKRL
ncbi:amino acid ABC transporter permease [Rhizobium paknamense]|uniref:Polar amino acid transport system permease protein n=1 Tax=Rhizobium paknamense TaxID=1206817 RepID=A0ABU0IGE3_9HYPH|nr:amino acid ABC transporter permease [Rhizobium paknamense]MDQ0456698.1 polar amino acid transport system permease protein [Rhizobium paknamense]